MAFARYQESLKKKKKKKNPYKLKLSANAIWPARKVLDSSLYGCVSCVFLIKKKKILTCSYLFHNTISRCQYNVVIFCPFPNYAFN